MNQQRREVSSRKIGLFHRLAQKFISLGLHPNHISVASSLFAILAGAALYGASLTHGLSSILLLIAALAGIQLRLICNLIDGLMAVEGGLKTPTGELYNDFPDRVSDIAIMIGAGYAASCAWPWAADLGWLAAVAAVMTAYTRVLGVTLKARHYFIGPMAKQHRMALMNVACLGCVVERCVGSWGYSLVGALAVISVGSLWTCVRRLRHISDEVNSLTDQ